MKHLITIVILCIGIANSADAQTFTQRIQQKAAAGQGTVTITQSEEIDQLVNSEVLSTTKANAVSTAPTANATPAANATTKPTTTKPTVNPVMSDPSDSQAQEVDTSKKMIRGGIKVNGFRVQAFAGGNSRKDRQQAEQVGNNIKAHFANVPVYVHFYSPRWICRVGNYRTYEEAHQMLVALRNIGYSQASIVKGKITIQQ